MKMKSKGCGTKKYANGGKKKSKTVTVSPTGNYKTVIKSTSKNGVTKNKATTRRTLKGVLSGAPSQKKLKNMTAPTPAGNFTSGRHGDIDYKAMFPGKPIAPAPRPLIPSNLKGATPLANPFKLKKRKDSVNTGSKVSISSKLGPVASELNRLAKGGKMKTKKYAMGGMSTGLFDGNGREKRRAKRAMKRVYPNYKPPKCNRGAC